MATTASRDRMMRYFLTVLAAATLMFAAPSAHAYHTIPPSMIAPRQTHVAPPPVIALPSPPVIDVSPRIGFVPPMDYHGTVWSKYAPRRYDFDDTPNQDFRERHQWLEQDLHLSQPRLNHAYDSDQLHGINTDGNP